MSLIMQGKRDKAILKEVFDIVLFFVLVVLLCLFCGGIVMAGNRTKDPPKIPEDIMDVLTVNDKTVEENSLRYLSSQKRQQFWADLFRIDWSDYYEYQEYIDVVTKGKRQIWRGEYGENNLIIDYDHKGCIGCITIEYSDTDRFSFGFGNCVYRYFYLTSEDDEDGGYGSGPCYTDCWDVFTVASWTEAKYYDTADNNITSQINTENEENWPDASRPESSPFSDLERQSDNTLEILSEDEEGKDIDCESILESNMSPAEVAETLGCKVISIEEGDGMTRYSNSDNDLLLRCIIGEEEQSGAMWYLNTNGKTVSLCGIRVGMYETTAQEIVIEKGWIKEDEYGDETGWVSYWYRKADYEIEIFTRYCIVEEIRYRHIPA